MRGKVTKKDNYGFIKGEDNNDYYMDSQSMGLGQKWQNLKKGENVEFEIIEQPKEKRDKAIKVKRAEDKIIKFYKENVLSIDDTQYDEFCTLTQKYAEKLRVNKVTTSKIRKIYSNILNADKIIEIKKLRPQFAYLAGRNEKNIAMKEFMDLLDFLVQKIEVGNKEQLENLKKFMEAVVAYRKYAGGDI